MIDARQLTKRYGEKTAVDGLDFVVKPGSVTGFLGPNGAGKSTTMRMIVGLDAPTSGTVTVNGRRYARHQAPLQEVGALLEAKSVHPGRSAHQHLRGLALTHGIPRRRVDEVIELAGLGSVARKRAGAFSLGMGQRLGIAAALLGDPQTVMLDEPVNGLDPEGVLWIRNLLTSLAAQGRTVFVSSHLMSEVAQVADHLIVVGRGRLLADTTVSELVREAGGDAVTVATDDPARLRDVLAGPGVDVTGRVGSEELQVTGLTAREVGLKAAEHGIPLFELTTRTVSLEQAFMDLTREAVEYHGTTSATTADAGTGTTPGTGPAATATGETEPGTEPGTENLETAGRPA
ncbi:ABC transporter ATP-binding protein [Streptomyces sp. NPDC002523]